MIDKNQMITRLGNLFSVNKASIDHIEIEDIAHALSHICRFNGHCSEFYSVAQHSLLVYEIAKQYRPLDLKAQYNALLHDAHEAYVGDVVSPLKRSLTSYQSLEDKVAEEVMQVLSTNFDDLTKNFDLMALVTEKEQLFESSEQWECLKNREAHPELFKKVQQVKFGHVNACEAYRKEFLKTFRNLRRSLT